MRVETLVEARLAEGTSRVTPRTDAQGARKGLSATRSRSCGKRQLYADYGKRYRKSRTVPPPWGETGRKMPTRPPSCDQTRASMKHTIETPGQTASHEKYVLRACNTHKLTHCGQ